MLGHDHGRQDGDVVDDEHVALRVREPHALRAYFGDYRRVHVGDDQHEPRAPQQHE